MRNRLTILTMILGLAFGVAACDDTSDGLEEDTQELEEGVEQGADEVEEGVEQGADDLEAEVDGG